MLPIDLNGFITLDDLLHELAADDPDARLFLEEGNTGPRGPEEGDLLARHTLLQCGFPELRPVTFWHPAADASVTAKDLRDSFLSVVIQVQLGGSHDGYGLSPIIDFLQHRTIRWPREIVAKRLATFGVRVPPSVLGKHGRQVIVELDSARRLRLLRELGGHISYTGADWKIKGMKRLIDREIADGRDRTNEKTVRGDLKKAADEERKAQREGLSAGPLPR